MLRLLRACISYSSLYALGGCQNISVLPFRECDGSPGRWHATFCAGSIQQAAISPGLRYDCTAVLGEVAV